MLSFEEALAQLASPGHFRLHCLRVLAYTVHCVAFNRDKALVLVKVEFGALYSDARVVGVASHRLPRDFEAQALDFSTSHLVVQAADRQGQRRLFFFKLEKTRSCLFPHFSKSLDELVGPDKAARFRFFFDREAETPARLITIPARQADHLYDVFDIGDHLLELRCRDRKCAANYSLDLEDAPAPRRLRLGELILPTPDKLQPPERPVADLWLFALLLAPLVIAANLGVYQEGRRQALLGQKRSGASGSMFGAEQAAQHGRPSEGGSSEASSQLP